MVELGFSGVLCPDGSGILAWFFRRRSPARRGVFKHKGVEMVKEVVNGQSWQGVVWVSPHNPFVDSDQVLVPLWRCGHRHKTWWSANACVSVRLRKRFGAVVALFSRENDVIF